MPGSSSRTVVAALAAQVEQILLPHAIAARREFLSGGYAPTALPWLGVPIPAVRAVVRELTRTTKDQSPNVVLQLALALSTRGSIEGRQVGYELIERRPDALALLTRATIERLGRGNDNWASVDAFAASVTGPAWRSKRLSDADVMAWAQSPDPWWRRTAIVSTVSLNTRSRGGLGDARRTLRICRAVLPGLTPMLAKALSWALRTLAPHDAAAVSAFLERHRDVIPASVRREVTTKLTTGKKSARRE